MKINIEEARGNRDEKKQLHLVASFNHYLWRFVATAAHGVNVLRARYEKTALYPPLYLIREKFRFASSPNSQPRYINASAIDADRSIRACIVSRSRPYSACADRAIKSPDIIAIAEHRGSERASVRSSESLPRSLALRR